MTLLELRAALARECQRTVDATDMDTAIKAALDRVAVIRLPCFHVVGSLTFTAGVAPLPTGWKSWGKITQTKTGLAMRAPTPQTVLAQLAGAPRYFVHQGPNVRLYPTAADGSIYGADWYAAPAMTQAGMQLALEQWPALVQLAAGCYLFRLYRNDDEYARREVLLMGPDGSGFTPGCEWFRARKVANTLEMGG
jgi:hypothetical protein